MCLSDWMVVVVVVVMVCGCGIHHGLASIFTLQVNSFPMCDIFTILVTGVVADDDHDTI